MAKRRMFSKDIVITDKFITMPATSRCLYFELAMQADDDGFVSNPKIILRMLGFNESDLKNLEDREYVTIFDNKTIYINHFKKQNNIPKDRYIPTLHNDEFEKIKKLPFNKLSEYGLLEDVGYVYVIQSIKNICKIGISKKPKIRISSIKSSEKTKFINTYISDKCYNKTTIEFNAHNHFKNKNVKGEWFDVTFSEAVECVKNIFNKIAITETNN